MTFLQYTKYIIADETGGGGGGFIGAIVGGVIGFFVAGPVGAAIGFGIGMGAGIVAENLVPDFDVPEFDRSPTYGSNQIGNAISEGIPVARCYGTCKIGVNKVRFNAKNASDMRIIFAICKGEIGSIDKWLLNDIAWNDLTGSNSKTSYMGTRTQTPDARFADKSSAYRDIAYVAATFEKGNRQIEGDPHLVVYLDGLKCTPLAGGAKAFTRNNAVVMYDWYTEVEEYSSGDIDVNSFQSLEALCDAVPTGGSESRYKFDFNFDTNITINDAKKVIWQSFNGRVIMSQGKLKAVWDSAQMADGSGGLTAKTVSHVFDVDNIVKDSLKWHQPERPNIVRIHYLDSTYRYKKSSVEVKDENDIKINGEIIHEEKCWFITLPEIARRRAQYKFNKFKYTDYRASLSALSGAGDLEVYDLVTVTHALPGWTNKQFLVTQKGEDQYGRMQFVLDAYYSGVYDDSEAGDQPGYEPDLPNPYDIPYEIAVGDITLAEVASQTFNWSPAVNVTFVEPTSDPFWSHVEVWISTDDSTFTFYGITSDGSGFHIETTGGMFQPGATLYVKLLSVSDSGVKDSLTNITSKSIVLSSVIRLGNFYVHANSFGNAAVEADATILLDSANTWIRVGASGSDHLLLDGDYSGEPAIRSSNYVSGYAGAGFLLKSDLLEVGNIACRGIFRTAVFQKDVISAVGGNVFISKSADVLDADMSAADNATLTIEGNLSFAVDDILRIKDGTNDEWFEVTNIGSAPTYTVTRDKGAQYGAGANPAWKKGATVVNYGQSGDGAIYLTASETNAPYIGVITHTGTPWTSVTTRLRIGNLNGFLGYSSDLYGIAIGETDKYLKYDPTNGLKIKGLVEIIGNPALQNMLMNGGLEDTDGTDAYYWTIRAEITTETSGGDDSNNYCKITRSGGYVYAHHLTPDASYRYFEVNEGEVYEFGGSMKSDGTCTGAIGIQIDDKDKANGSWLNIFSTDAAWTTKSTTYTVPAGKKFIRFYIVAMTADGWAAFDNIYLKRVDEKAWSFTHSSDRTKIDGGNIYANSLTLTSAASDFVLTSIGGDTDDISEGTNKFAAEHGADITSANNQGLGWLIGSSGTLTISATGKLAINTTDALEIQASGNVKVLAGADIKLIGSDSDPGNIFFEGTSYAVKMGGDADGNRFYISPESHDDINMYIGTEAPWGTGKFPKKLQLESANQVLMRAFHTTYDSPLTYAAVYSRAYTSYCDVLVNLTFEADTSNLQFKKTGASAAVILPDANKEWDLGNASYAFDDAYADDWHNVADFYHLDTRDDLAAIKAIKGSGVISDVTGLELIDDATIPEWMLSRHKKDGEDVDSEGNVIESWKKSAVMYDPDGKPYLSMKLMTSLLMGAIRQLDTKIEKIINP